MSNAIFLKIHPDNPPQNKVLQVVEVLRKGGLIIYPTDPIYGLGCDLHNARAIERLCQIKGISTQTYKIMKKALPGPFTFILEASAKVPKFGGAKKKTVGIRVPDNEICLTIVKELGNPIISTSIHDEDEVIEYSTDPELIYEKYRNLVDLVIDAGYGNNIASTVVNCTDDEMEVLREGAGDLDQYL